MLRQNSWLVQENGSVEINGNTLLNDPQDHLVGGKLFPITFPILLMYVVEDNWQLAYLYFLEYHFFLEYAGFPEAVLTFGFGKPFTFFVSLWEVAAFPYGWCLLAAG